MRASLERQLLLPELSGGGQVRLFGAPLLLPPGEPEAARALAREYARRAGLADDLPADEQVQEAELPTFAHEAFFRHAPSRDVGRGAHLALVSIHRALADTSDSAKSGSSTGQPGPSS